MHICPQEIMMVIGAVDILRPTLWMVKHWCEGCFNGTHKSCKEHAEAVSQQKEQLVTNE